MSQKQPVSESATTWQPGDARMKRRVLIVDDNREMAETAAALLIACGHDVRTAYDGLSAVATAGEYHPNVVLLDIGLPGMDGAREFSCSRKSCRSPGRSGALQRHSPVTDSLSPSRRSIMTWNQPGQCWLTTKPGPRGATPTRLPKRFPPTIAMLAPYWRIWLHFLTARAAWALWACASADTWRSARR